MGNFITINWEEKSIQEYLKDKDTSRSPHYKEYLHIVEFIKEHRFKRILDLGTWTGISGYIMATSCDSIEKLISIDWGEWYAKNIKKIEFKNKNLYGMYLPEGASYIDSDFRICMKQELINNDIEFAFIDDGHGLRAVIKQLDICYESKTPYIAIHDVTKGRMPRKAVSMCIRKKQFKKIYEDIESSPNQGIIFLERVND